jgi:glycosyltransferase involved in cell wall biosynthesis
VPNEPAGFDVVHLAYTEFPADTRVKREALAVAALGLRVAVIALRRGLAPAEEEIGPLHVVRLPGTKSRGGPATYLIEYGAFVWRCRRLLEQDRRFRNVRIVHVHTLPDFLVWSATPARRRGARIVLDLHEIFPEFAASKYPGFFGTIARRFALLSERDARRRADVTITVNQPIADLLHSRRVQSGERLEIIHNSPDPSDFGEARQFKGGPDTTPLQLIYHGTLTPLYGLDVAIRGVAKASHQGASVRFTILGDGPQRRALQQLVAQLDAQSIVAFEEPIPQASLPDRLTRCDAGIVPTRLDVMTQYSLSNKLLEYVHLGIPVVAARLPSYTRYFNEDAAWFWDAGNEDDLARAIMSFATASHEEREKRTRLADEALSRISWPRERKQLQQIYTELLRDSRIAEPG